MTRTPASSFYGRRVRHLAPGLAAVVAIAIASMSPSALAAGPPGVARGRAAAGWLARQLAGRSHLVSSFGGKTYPNQGETIDAVLAFAAAGTADGYAARAMAWLARPKVLAGYVGNGTSSSYAGATAKLALAAEVRGLNPARFGGVNLIARLGALLTPSGRYSDHSSYGDFSNAFSQSLAILALHRRGGVPPRAVAFLAASECGNGGFPLDFGTRTCASDTDATALDVQALLAAGRRGPAERGLRWLAAQQAPDGGLTGAGGGAAPNANTTGLAGEAFGAAAWRHRAALARGFLIRLQAGCAAPAARRGAISYHLGHFSLATAADATAQGVLGLAGTGLARLTSRDSTDGDPRMVCS